MQIYKSLCITNYFFTATLEYKKVEQLRSLIMNQNEEMITLLYMDPIELNYHTFKAQNKRHC